MPHDLGDFIMLWAGRIESACRRHSILATTAILALALLLAGFLPAGPPIDHL